MILQRINKTGKGIAREEAGVILEWMIWENFSKEVTFEQRTD